MTVNVCAVFASDEVERSEIIAPYGTPVIDGVAESLWDGAGYNVIEKIYNTSDTSYKGWFKVMWDEESLYFYAKVYSNHFSDEDENPWNNDSFEVFVDELMDRSTKYGEDDYQLRSDFKGSLSGTNYDFENMEVAAKAYDDYYVVEMKAPSKIIKYTEGTSVGFDVQVNEAKTISKSQVLFRYSQAMGNLSSNNSKMGTLTLKKSVNVSSFSEPAYVGIPGVEFDGGDTETAYAYMDSVKVKFDWEPYTFPVLTADYHAMMSISDVATAIHGTTDGNTLKKGNVSVKYVAGNRLAEYGDGHIILEETPVMYGSELYIPVSSLMITFLYNVQFYRFDNLLEITTGTNYPSTLEKVVNVSDYGAVGDGVHDDGDAIRAAIAAANRVDGLSKVVFGKNKTYLMGEKNDSWSQIYLRNVNNLILEGNGSTLLNERCANSFIRMEGCSNIKVYNLTFDYVETPSTQGRIKSIDSETASFVLEIEDGYEFVADDEWIQYFQDSTKDDLKTYSIGMVCDPVENRMKYINADNFRIAKIERLEGRECRVTVESSYVKYLSQIDPGDRFVIKKRYTDYDFGSYQKDGKPHNLFVNECADVTFDGVYSYGSNIMYALVAASTGRIIFRNSGYVVKPGTNNLVTLNQDGIHALNNRCGLLIENCTFENNLDDMINTKATTRKVTAKLSNNSMTVETNPYMRLGDELVFVHATTGEYLGNAFIESYTTRPGLQDVTFDRDISHIPVGAISYNKNASGPGTVVRNNKFINCRRHAYLCRTGNTLIDNNEIIGCGGSIAVENEALGFNEGPIPGTVTIRNNVITGTGNTPSYYPIQVRIQSNELGDEAAIDGVLIEGNTVSVPNKNASIYVHSVTDLYMIDNKVTNSVDGYVSKPKPVVVLNSSVAKVSGLDVNFKNSVDSALYLACVKLKDGALGEINVTAPGGAKSYIIE